MQSALSDRPMKIQDFAKTDVDQVLDLHISTVREQLKTLMRKLYLRNPSHWRRAGKPSAEFLVQRVFRPQRVPNFVELGDARGIDAIRLAFEDDYGGDRVLALMAGLVAMTEKAYGNRRELFALDQLDPQKLYNCARNYETAAWLLRTRTNADGTPLLLSNSLEPDAVNLSFERAFGKLIATQDMAARIVADQTQRTIRGVVQRVAGAFFFPI